MTTLHRRICLLIVPLFVACDARDATPDDRAADEQVATTPAPSPEAPPESGDVDERASDAEDPDPAFEGTTAPTTREPATESIVILDDIRSARRDGYDRVVFEFRGGERPGHRVRYVDRVTQCASGHELEVEGAAFLEVSVSPAAAYEDVRGERVQTVAQRDRRPGLPGVLHLKEYCDHHGGIGWAIGLDRERRYRVLELNEPLRLVIDIRHDD